MSAAFVGRGAELEAIARVLASAANGHTAAAVVIGEPGSGKSSLLARAAAAWKHGDAASATGFEPMQSIQLAAAGGLLRALGRGEAGAHLDALVFGSAGETAGGDRAGALRIFEAAHRALAERGPLLLLVDDLQWFDAQSLALLHYLLHAQARGEHRLALVAAARPSPAALSLRDAVRGALPGERAALIDLGPLPLQEGVALVRGIDGSVDEATAAELWRAAAGSPFWLDALARRRGGDSTASLIEDRLRALTPDASALLALLAVAGRPLPPEDVARLPDQPPDRVRHAVRELTVQGLVVDSAGGMRTAHDLIRDEVVRLLPAPMRRRVDASVAEIVEATAGDDARLLAEALEHRVAAGLDAGELCARMLAAPNRRMLGTANLQLAARVADALDERTDRSAMDGAIATLAAAAGEQELALERWARAARLATTDSQRVRAHVEAARAAAALGRGDDAHAHCGHARATIAGGADVAAHLAVDLDALEAGIELWLDHHTAAGSRRAQDALGAARVMVQSAAAGRPVDADARRAYLRALQASGDAALQQDRCHDMAALADETIAAAHGLGEDWHVAALLRAGLAHRHLLQVHEAEARFRSAWEMSKRLVLPTYAIEAGHGLCVILRDLGRLGEAHRIGTEAAGLEERLQTGAPQWLHAGAALSTVALYLGDVDATLQALRRQAQRDSDAHFRLGLHQVIAIWQARYAGVRAQAEVRDQVALGLRFAVQAGCPRCGAELRLVCAEALARVGDSARAQELVDAVAAEGMHELPSRRLWGLRARAQIAVAAGDTEAATAMLQQLAAQAERDELPLERVWTQIDLARLLAGSDRHRAVELLTEAATVAEHCGSASQARIAARELRQLGVRAWRRGAGGDGDALAALSRREREIVAHLARGRSNAEIAGALLVSPKTVERHVTNVLAKLSLRNRTEVAALVRSGTPGTGFPR